MAYFGDNWIRVFDIPETSKHSKGFTIYKIVSIVYPKKSPDAVTKVTVWKRYNDFKKLHRDLKDRYKTMQISEKYPSIVSSSYFKRFDPDVINQRRSSALEFLEFVAQHPPLFVSTEFVKFFESSHTPREALKSNINIIRAQLNLPNEPEETFPSFNSDEEHDHSDSDTVSTFSIISTTALNDVSTHSEHVSGEEKEKLDASNISKISSRDSVSSTHSTHSFHEVSTESTSSVSTVNAMPLSSESLLLEHNNTVQYLTNASQFITQAVEFEVEKRFEESFAAYKSGIQCLLTGVRSDTDLKRRQMVRHKTEVYLLRAEKIYNLHLSPEMNQIRECIRRNESEMSYSISSIKRPTDELFDYKVLKIVENGMVVLNKKEQNIFYMKVIEKNPQTPSSVYVNIPKEVPYMVKLFQYYDCFNSVFIVTQYISGQRLFDYVKRRSTNNPEITVQYSNITFEREVDQDSGNFDENNSDSSEGSYSDLILNYTLKKDTGNENDDIKTHPSAFSLFSDNENISEADTDQSNSISDEVFLRISSSTGDLVSKSRSLNTSVSDSLLQEKSKCTDSVLKSVSSHEEISCSKMLRQCSEKSYTEEFSIVKYVLPLDEVVKWASQLVLALEKLHRAGVIVTDLNPRNLLLDDNQDVRLTFMFNFQDSNKIYCSSFEENLYVAPEVFRPQTVTFAADWWSYGVILYELLTGMPLHYVHFDGISSNTYLKIPKYVCPEGKSLLRQLLVYEPRERLGCGVNGTDDLKSHPFFNSVDWDKLLVSSLD